LERRLVRERAARAEAEQIAERVTRQLYTRQREMELVEEVARAANEAHSFEEAARVALDRMCTYASWSAGHCFIPTEDGTLVSAGVWSLRDARRHAALQSVSARMRFAPGVGLPGRVFAAAAPAWIPDVTRDANFPRARDGVELGVRGTAAFPVFLGREVAAVLEFFSDVPLPEDPRVFTLSEHVCAQLSRVIERDRHQARMVAARAQLEAEVAQRTAELRAALEAAAAANLAKGVFLATMSHEIRTPLGAVLSIAELLRESPLDGPQRAWVEALASSGELLLGILNNVLDWSKIEADHVTLDRAPFDLPDLLHKTLAAVTPQATRRGLTLRLALEPTVPTTVVGDALRIRQVLSNLIGNGLKFTAEGGVTLRVRAVDAALMFEVVDTGMGFDDAVGARLFSPFQQADGSITRRFGGTGLGLAICKRLVEIMDGAIGARSEPGRGATFWFRVPLEVARAAVERVRPLSIAAPRAIDPRPVLVAEDNATNQRILTTLLERLGYSALVVGDGQAALDAIAAGDFQAALMDCQMPGLDGLETTRRLRAREGDGRHLPVIAITANAFDSDRAACREAGMDDFLVKPIRREQLRDALQRCADAAG
jgi:signal transduction histidine kinase/ActR/RegA family two-component response regulator